MKTLLTLQGFTAKQGRSADLIEWLKNNEDRLRASAPDGIEYVGVFGNVFSSEKTLGDTIMVVGLDNYAAMDTWAAMRGSEFGDLIDQFFEFMDPDKNADTSNLVLKAAAAVTVWGDEAPPE